MRLKSLELAGFKSFGKKAVLDFNAPISSIVGPNGSGKSNIAEAFRFVLGEQSIKSMRGKRGEDLIFNGGKNASRANRAGAKLIFDNSDRLFDVDFEEVVIERVVHRDGVNQYSINGSQVRLRDVTELLSSAGIGSSGHHIISQGEADRILNASPRERREMIDDALGLKIYHFKLLESEKKLRETKENLTQVEALRNEIKPHIRFLKKQVEQIERVRELRENLKERYREYLRRESVYLTLTQESIVTGRVKPEKRAQELEAELTRVKDELEAEKQNADQHSNVIELEKEMRTVREKKDVLSRDLGRIEGEIRAEERGREAFLGAHNVSEGSVVPMDDVRALAAEVEAKAKEAQHTLDLGALRSIIETVRALVQSFLKEHSDTTGYVSPQETGVLNTLKDEERAKKKELDALAAHEEGLRARYEKLRREIETTRDKSRAAERAMFQVMQEQNEIRTALETLSNREQALKRERAAFDQELKEGAVLVGRDILSFEDCEVRGDSGTVLTEVEIASEDRAIQERRRREIEKIKIRIEEAGSGSGEEVLKEYEEVEERDRFLESEIEDLEKSAEALNEIMADLEEKLAQRFKEGIAKINREFQTFFALMFGGGAASLSVIQTGRRGVKRDILDPEAIELDREEPEEAGIDISVSLPHKRIKGLMMLSGGERALTSIALLFAMSRVHPPPFLILDETDAALDEANSKRYGDMIENLAQQSQLILITHNRETMSRAGILYGVTMGNDGISKLLSVKFDEAVKVAK
jgi:chromosome segregation protein